VVRRLLYLSGLSIFAVVIFHAAGLGFVAMFAWAHRYTDAASGATPDAAGSLSYWLLRAEEQITVFAIPAFMFVSGFFMAFATGRAQRTVAWSSVLARIKGLLIPYTVWTLVLLGFAFVQGRRLGLAGLAQMYLTGSVSPAYYYVPLLIQLYLLAPFLIPVARKKPITLLVITGLIQLAVLLSYYPLLLGAKNPQLIALGQLIPKWLFITRIFAFSSGIVAGFHLPALKGFLEKSRVWLIVAALALIPVGIIEWEFMTARSSEWLAHRETFVDVLYSAALILAILAASQTALPFTRSLEALGGRTYGVYLIHMFGMESFARGLYHFAPTLLGYQIILQPLLIAVGLVIPLGLMWLVSHTPANRYYRYIFG
jgi:peptidoglycan/LPS O-acetylase OafA/YrhL